MVTFELDKTLKREVKLQKARIILDEQLKQIPNIQAYKLSNQITLLVCEIIEYLFKVNSKKYKVDKKAMVKEILIPIFGLTEDEIKIIDTQIEYLHGNGLIKSIPIYKQALGYLLYWVKKKD